MITKHSKKTLQLYKDRLNILLNLTQIINEDHDIEELLSEFERLLREDLEVGKILVYSYSEGKWANVLMSGVSEEEVNKINVERDLLIYKNIENITISPPENLRGFDAIIPLSHRFKIIAYVLIGDVDDEFTGISPTIKHLKLIQIISNLIIVFIENLRMHNAILAQEVIKKEMELASKIQNQLIPNEKNLPKIKGISIQTIYLAHLGVGGDYYDFIQLSQNTIGFCIADVSGKGISAALLMSNFQAILRSLFTSKISLKKLVVTLNDKVNESAHNEKFITMFIGKFNNVTRKLTYINAGHLPPIFYDLLKQNITHLEKGCIGLGMLDVIPKIEEGNIKVPYGAKLVAFTDGLVEIESDNQIHADTNLLEKFIKNPQTVNENILEIRKFIDKNIDKNSFFDDITLIGMGFH